MNVMDARTPTPTPIPTYSGRPASPSPVPSALRLRTAAHRRTWWSALGLDSLYVLLGFPLAIVSFTLLVTGVSLSIGLLPIWFGFPIGVGTLFAARLFATVERARLDARGAGSDAATAAYRPVSTDTDWVRRMIAVFRDPQSWLDLLHGVIILPVSTITFSIVVSWWAGGVGGVTYWLWGRAIDDDSDKTLAELLDIGMSDAWFYGLLGGFMLLTLVPVVWACASAQAGLTRSLLANDHVAELDRRAGAPTWQPPDAPAS